MDGPFEAQGREEGIWGGRTHPIVVVGIFFNLTRKFVHLGAFLASFVYFFGRAKRYPVFFIEGDSPHRDRRLFRAVVNIGDVRRIKEQVPCHPGQVSIRPDPTRPLRRRETNE